MSKNSVGFVVEDLAPSQTIYSLIYNSNKYLANQNKTEDRDICLFFMDSVPPCIKPEFARYYLKDAFGFTGSLIATTPKTAVSIKDFSCARRYYYITDINDFKNAELINVLTSKENKIKLVFRCPDHLLEANKIYAQLDILKTAIVIYDYDVEQFLKLEN